MEWNAFERNIKTNWNSFAVEGKVVIKNTVEAFKKEDKTAFIRRGAEALWQIIVDGSWLAVDCDIKLSNATSIPHIPQ